MSIDEILDRCVSWAASGITREHPHHFPLFTQRPQSFSRPRDLTPVFYGCFDWHSAVHSHWLLVRCLRCRPNAPWADDVAALLSRQFTRAGLAGEFRFFAELESQSFERPYGWAWLLQLAAELHASPRINPDWRESLRPLEELLADRIRAWLPELHRPVRTGEHSQTAFALGLIADWANSVGADEVHQQIRDAVARFYLDDVALPMAWEPSAYDFLSPALAEADVVRRVLPPREFADWLERALPGFPDDGFPAVTPTDLADGKAAHFAGLNFSRAWMLDGIVHGLPTGDPRRSAFAALSAQHLSAGLPVLQTNEYAVTHWVGSFVVYAVTRRGVGQNSETIG